MLLSTVCIRLRLKFDYMMLDFNVISAMCFGTFMRSTESLKQATIFRIVLPAESCEHISNWR